MINLLRFLQFIRVFLVFLPFSYAFTRIFYRDLVDFRRKSSLFGRQSCFMSHQSQVVFVVPSQSPESFRNSVKESLSKIGYASRDDIEGPSSRISVIPSNKFIDATVKPNNAIPIFLYLDGFQEGPKDIASLTAATYSLLLSNEPEQQHMNEILLKSFLQRLNSCSSEDSILSRPDIALEAGRFSHFLSLTYPDLREALPDLSELRKGIDAFELRVDLLADLSAKNIHKQISLLKTAFPDLPIIYTVRTKNQIGQYPDEDYDGIERLLIEGVRAGVEWLDVEANLPPSLIERFCQKAKTSPTSLTRIIGSYHTRSVCSNDEIRQMFDRCDLSGHADVLKVVTGAEKKEDSLRLHHVAQSLSKPYIGLCLGEVGAYSRVLNQRYTPVTHEKMKTVAAPGQLTAKQLHHERVREGLIEPRQYYLFGHPIQHSLSPKLHNTAYETLFIPTSSYALKESENVDIYPDIMSQEKNFHGASVTIPHKESIIPFLQETNDVVREIGAVNTVSRVKEGDRSKLIGFNTDWLGMYKPIKRLLLKRSSQSSSEGTNEGYGLVIGAGGTARAACYVMKRLGLKVIVANRSPDKAIDLASRFNGTSVSFDQLSQLPTPHNLQVVISTLPFSAAFTLPPSLLQQSKPIVLDVVYKPALTPLLAQAKANDCPVVQGGSMLLEQAIEQFQIWNNRLAPRQEMKAILFNSVEKIDSTD